MPDTNLTRLFHDLFHNAARLMHRSHKAQGRGHTPVHRAQGLVLYILDEKGDTSQRDLMETLDIRSSSLSELLAKLEQQGYITRTRDENDKRGFIISITPEGAAVVEDFKKMRKEQEDALFRSLSEEERAQLAAIITKLIDAWKDAADDGDGFHSHIRERIHEHMHGRMHPHMMGHKMKHGHDNCENNQDEEPRGGHGRGRKRF